MIVVDTNVIAYFVIPGPASSAAEKVRLHDADWAAPLLWRSELRNVITSYLRQNLMSLSKGNAHFAEAEELLSDNEYQVDSERVLELAHASGCTAYDCEFVSLAEGLSVPLVTSDKKVLTAFPAIAVSMDEFVGNS